MSGLAGRFRRVVLGVSGGVDSAVSALLLKRKGYEVIGVFMRNWDLGDETGHCSNDADAEDAEWVCRKLDIPFHEINYVKEYWNDVFMAMVEDYKAGLTPNPDILCNKNIKFRPFLNHAKEVLNADVVATGHYARTSFGEHLEKYDPRNGVRLLRAMDRQKDQTFFLSQIDQTALQHTMFPLGEYTKDVVRMIAKSAGLDRVASKKDSTGICFIGSRNFQDFIAEYIEDRPGDFIELETGEVIGKHRGIHMWTVGQRCNIPGKKNPYFVAEKLPDSGNITVVAGTKHPALFSSTMLTESLYWIHKPPQDLYTQGHLECQFRFQNTQPLVDCVATPDDLNPWHRSPTQNNVFISLAHPKRAITPGQYAVLYQGDECLGSAKIIRPGPSLYTMDTGGCRTRLQQEREEQTPNSPSVTETPADPKQQ
ncbi:mitochondrial tRNA-specific 2-thiouridylase 1 isoform X2 [Oratosquilla oratoria]|uniref:mitochondrial tRNA-specific 2-thiouridylase 1 isoform X2 n=1 Tax=Oratosquilla oratoria TaxID=337810 RepID=UPI003F75AA38